MNKRMKRCQRILSVFFTVILLFSSVDSAVLAEGQEDFVTVSSNNSEVLGESVSENELPESEKSVSDNDVPELEESVSDNIVEETAESDVSANDVSESKTETSMTMTTSAVTASGKCGDNLSWTLSDGVLTISGTGAMEDYISGFTGWEVPWVEYKSDIKTLVLNEGITYISSSAFSGCDKIEGELILPHSLVEIGSSAFQGCSGFSGDLVIPDSVESIGSSAFAYCSGFDGKLILPSNIRVLESYVFDSCSGLAGTLTIPESVEVIENGAFYNCSGFTGDLIIPDNVKTIESFVFRYCSGFDGKLELPDNLKIIESCTFQNCTGLTGTLVIPDTVERIESFAFQYCENFTGSLVIPDSVVVIEEGAFSGCGGFDGNLKLPNGIEKVEESTFNWCSGLSGVLTIPESITYIGREAFGCCSSFTGTLTIPKGVEKIDEYAFNSCIGFTGNLVIPDNVKTVGQGAFQSCIGLDGKIEISDSMTEIASYTFWQCSGLTGDLIIGNNIRSISAYAFANCKGLNGNVYIPETVEIIDSLAFSGMTLNVIYGVTGSYAETYAKDEGIDFNSYNFGLTRLAPPSANFASGTSVDFGTEVTLNCENGAKIYYTLNGSEPSLESILYEEPISIFEDTEIRAMAVKSGCQNSKVVTLTYSLTDNSNIVGGNCGYDYYGYVSDNVKWSLNIETGKLTIYGTGEMTSYGNQANSSNVPKGSAPWMEYEEYIKTLDIRKGVASIGDCAFDGCVGLQGNLNIPSSVTSIGSGAFRNCSGLTGELVIPESVTEIGYNAFKNCSGFTGDLVIPVNVKEIGFDAFAGCSGFNGTLKLSSNIKKIETWTFSGCSGIKGNLIIPDGVETISSYAFEGCMGLEGYTVTLPDSLTLIDKYAFIGKTGNLDITIQCNPGTYAEKWAKANGFFGKIKISSIPAQIFTGTQIKPKVEVSHGDKILVEGKDYTLTYKDNVDAGEQIASVSVKGKGNYSGQSEARKFTINPKEIANENIVAQSLTPTYSGKVQNPSPTITVDGKKLTKNKDYTLSYPDTVDGAYREAGIWNIKVTGKGNYTGEATVTFRILAKTEILASKLSVGKIATVNYEEGQKAEPKPVISYKGTKLVEGEDYSLSYSSNDKAGKATLTITGLEKEGNVSVVGSCTKTFTIKGTAISKAKVEYSKTQPFTGSQICPEVKLTVDKGTTSLREGTDYSVSYGVNTKVGKGTITITGIGGYTGTMKKTFTIQAVNMTTADDNLQIKFVDGIGESSYALAGAKPEVEVYWGETKLELGTDYTVSYKNNKAVKGAAEAKAPTVTVKGKGNYKGSKSVFFTITEKDLTDDDVIVSVPDKVYNAKGKYQSTPVITDGDGKKLTAGKNYKILGYYVDGKELPAASVLPIGTEVTVKMQGIGSYQKEIEATYRIVERDIAKATIKITAVEYTGDPITFTEEDFINGNIKVTSLKGVEAPVYGEDFIISGYKNNTNKGTAQVTFKGISDNWGGSKTVKFTIKVKKMK